MATRKVRVRFKPIKEFPGYYAGSDGSIWTSGYVLQNAYFEGGKWKKIKSAPHGDGYRYVMIRYPDECWDFARRLVHRLVLVAFRGRPPAGMEAAHENGNPADNRLDNLRWKTHHDNMLDRERHGTLARGERSGNWTLGEAKVREIVRLRAKGLKTSAISRAIQEDYDAVYSVVSGRTWGWLTGFSRGRTLRRAPG